MKYTEEYIISKADSIDWSTFECEQSVYSEEFMDRFKYKIKRYTLNSLYHSYKDSPAFIDCHLSKKWFKNGQLHRGGDKPAVIHNNGEMEWYKNGLCHRDNDKPAAIWSNGDKEWFKNGVEYLPDEQ